MNKENYFPYARGGSRRWGRIDVTCDGPMKEQCERSRWNAYPASVMISAKWVGQLEDCWGTPHYSIAKGQFFMTL